MTKFIVFEDEGTTVKEELERNYENIIIGDIIEYITNNQMGWKKFIVIDNNGDKILKLIDSYFHQIGILSYNE
jgi:hypothetical protein